MERINALYCPKCKGSMNLDCGICFGEGIVHENGNPLTTFESQSAQRGKNYEIFVDGIRWKYQNQYSTDHEDISQTFSNIDDIDIHELSYKLQDRSIEKSYTGMSLQEAKRAFVRRLRVEFGLLDVDVTQIRSGYAAPEEDVASEPLEPGRRTVLRKKPTPPLTNFEVGLQMFNDLIDPNRRPITRVTETRRYNQAIQLMASDDYDLMRKFIVNDWVIDRALRNWEPDESGIRWRKKENK